MDDPPPQKRHLGLKAREVEPVDKVARPGDGTAISVQLFHKTNQLAAERKLGPWSGDLMTPPPGTEEPEGGSSIFRRKEITPMDPPSGAGGEEAISIEGMLRRNHAAAREAGPELVAMPVKRRSRRNRDFIVLLGGALISIGVLAAIFRADRQIVALSLFGIVFATVILAWIMYGVMDRY